MHIKQRTITWLRFAGDIASDNGATSMNAKECSCLIRCAFQVAVVVGVTGLALQSSRADTIAIQPDFDSDFSTRPGDDATRGWLFSVVDGPILVTNLGFYDEGGDGLLGAHEVAIWDSATRRAIVSATIPDESQSILIDHFRYEPITPTTLSEGVYTIGASYTEGTDSYLTSVSDKDFADEIFYHRDQVALGAFAFPSGQGENAARGDSGYFGPNFLFVPEPNALGLTVIAMMLVIRRRTT